MDIQLVLVIILLVLTINLVAVGIYLILVLKDLRTTIKKANVVLSDVNFVTHLFSNPLASITTLLTHVVKGFRATKPVKSLVDFDDDKEDE